MRVLITGGAGFIGSHLAEHLQRQAAVRVLDDLRTGHQHNLTGLDVEFVHGSILDRELISTVIQVLITCFTLRRWWAFRNPYTSLRRAWN